MGDGALNRWPSTRVDINAFVPRREREDQDAGA
jgi:hypothetical protein